MTVQELIEALSTLPQDAMLVSPGYEGGVEPISVVSKVKLKLNVHDEWYYGSHEIDEEDGDTTAVFIG